MGDELVQLLPRVSVIVPSFNHKNYVEEAVNSVLSQVQDTFKLELLVVDDGSSDGSVDVLKALHSRAGESFQLILKGNEGLCQTLNRVIRDCSSGTYIAVLASDDLWHPEKLTKQLECMRSNPAARLCYSNAEVFGFDTMSGRRKSGKAQRYQFSGRVNNLLPLNNFVPAGSVMFSRDLFDEIEGFDQSGLRLEDWDFLIRASVRTPFCLVKECLLFYRQHDESAISRMRRSGTLFSEKMKVLRKNCKLLNPLVSAASVFINFALDKLIRPVLSRVAVDRF